MMRSHRSSFCLLSYLPRAIAVCALIALGGCRGPVGFPPTARTVSFDILDGTGKIVAHDGHYLGLISSNRYLTDSIVNEYGTYGNKYNGDSILNRYGTYGNKYSMLSPFNEYTTTPPEIYANDVFVAYLTVNEALTPRIDPYALLGYLAQKR